MMATKANWVVTKCVSIIFLHFKTCAKPTYRYIPLYSLFHAYLGIAADKYYYFPSVKINDNCK